MKKEDLVVKKDNWLVQKTLNRFTKQQNRLMALLIGRFVNLEDNKVVDTSVSIDEFRKALGINDDGRAYARLKRAVIEFGASSSVCFESTDEQGKPELRWLPYFTEITLKRNVVSFKWHPDMVPHLTGLKRNYMQYLASDYLKLKSQHSQNLYELLKSVESYEKTYRKPPCFSIAGLRKQLNVGTKYKKDHDFLSRCIARAVKEINEKTDIIVQTKPVTGDNGRTPVAVKFYIRRREWNATKAEREKMEAIIEAGGMPGWYSDTGHAIDPTKPEDQALLQKALDQQKGLKPADGLDGEIIEFDDLETDTGTKYQQGKLPLDDK